MLPITSARLYGILDLGYVAPENAILIAERMLAGGIDVIQLRAKNLRAPQIESIARDLHPLTRAAAVPLIINDHPAIAARVGAEGVHVGQDDLSIVEVRRTVPADCIVGRSTHSRDQARAAAAEGADYIGFGPLFATPTKPAYTPIGLADIAWVHDHVAIPVFCIGGIKRENTQAVVDAGAKRIVIVSGILSAEDIPEYIGGVKPLLPPL